MVRPSPLHLTKRKKDSPPRTDQLISVRHNSYLSPKSPTTEQSAAGSIYRFRPSSATPRTPTGPVGSPPPAAATASTCLCPPPVQPHAQACNHGRRARAASLARLRQQCRYRCLTPSSTATTQGPRVQIIRCIF